MISAKKLFFAPPLRLLRKLGALLASAATSVPLFCRRWPKTAVVLGLLLCLLAGWGGVNIWADYQLRAAERAWQEDRTDDARRHIESCLFFRPVQAHLLGARIERLLGRYREAEQHLRDCKDSAGMTQRIQLEWVLLRALQGELTDLERPLWESVKKKDPDASLILETLAICYVRDFRYRYAAHALTMLLER